jgi:hypothetical protein
MLVAGLGRRQSSNSFPCQCDVQQEYLLQRHQNLKTEAQNGKKRRMVKTTQTPEAGGAARDTQEQERGQ